MKYDKKIISKFCEELKKLKGRVGACRAMPICYDTFLDWMKKHPEFAEAVKKAESEANETGKEIAVMSIFKAMPNQWQAAAWWLERKYSEDFALKLKQEHTGKDGGPLIPKIFAEKVFSLDELKKLINKTADAPKI